MNFDLQSTDWREHLPLEFAIPVRRPLQVRPAPPDNAMEPIAQHFVFGRGVRPDLTRWYYYSCSICGFTVGLQWLRMGAFELLTHDCQHRCCHLAFMYEDSPEGEKLVKTVPAFRRDGKCWRCGVHYSETCRSASEL